MLRMKWHTTLSDGGSPRSTIQTCVPISYPIYPALNVGDVNYMPECMYWVGNRNAAKIPLTENSIAAYA